MANLTEEERQKILSSPPIGTLVLMATVLVTMLIGWLFMYFGVFLPRGIIN